MLASGRFRRNALLTVGGLVVLSIAWVVVTGLLARQQVNKLESRLEAVKELVAQGKIDQAQQEAAGIPTLAKRAHLLTTGPAWWAVAEVPYLGDPFDVMRGATAAGKSVGTSGVETLLHIAKTLDPKTLRSAGDSIRLAPLQASAPELRTAAVDLDNAIRRVDGLPGRTWFGSVNHARLSLSVQLHSIVGYVDAAANATNILPTMLGAHGTQRYFIGLQNEAEMRGTGGLPGAFAIVEATNGRIKFTHFGSDAELLPAQTKQRIPTGLDFGKDYDALYGTSSPTDFIVNSNISPHFPYAAQIWSRMWQKISGQKVDGALAVDPTTLAYFLSVTGPVTLPDGGQVTAANVVSLVEKDEYALFPLDNQARKDFLVSILRASSQKLTSGAGSASQLAQTMTAVSNQNRLQVWSADPAIEKVLASTSYGAAIPTDKTPFGALILNNAAAGKLDYYLVRTMDYRRTGCGSQRDVFVTITLTNNAPASGLSPYVLGRLDSHDSSVQPGDNRTLFDYYGSDGAELLSATIDGQPATMSVLTDLGKRVFRTDLELPRGKTTTMTLHLQEPAGVGPPLIWKQPGVTNLGLHVFSQPCCGCGRRWCVSALVGVDEAELPPDLVERAHDRHRLVQGQQG